jgi:hypothetical protein
MLQQTPLDPLLETYTQQPLRPPSDPLWTPSGPPSDPLWTPSGPPLDPLPTLINFEEFVDILQVPALLTRTSRLLNDGAM